MPGQFGTALLQGLDALVFPKHVVAHGSVKHGLTHAGRGLRDGVAAQVHQEVGRRRLKLT